MNYKDFKLLLLSVSIHMSKTRDNALDAVLGLETIVMPLKRHPQTESFWHMSRAFEPNWPNFFIIHLPWYVITIFYYIIQIDKKRENVENEGMKTIKPYLHKVNYYETDKMGITHHSNYIRYMEEARVDFLDQLGWSFIKLEEEGMASPVMSVEGVYKKSTTFPDTISIMVGIEKLSAAKLTFSYEFKCKDEVVFLGKSTHCFLDTNGRPVLIERQYPKFYAELKEIAEAGKKE